MASSHPRERLTDSQSKKYTFLKLIGFNGPVFLEGVRLPEELEHILGNTMFFVGVILFIFGVFFGEVFKELPIPNIVFALAGLALIIVSIFYRSILVKKKPE